MSYLICGLETCPLTQRKHWQCYMETHRKITLNGIKNWVHKYADPSWGLYHLEFAVADSDKNITYCTKDCGDIFMEFGEPMQAGIRANLAGIVAHMLAGNITLRDIRAEQPYTYHQYGRTLDKVSTDMEGELTRTRPLEVYWFWGDTGTGKSHTARTEASANGASFYSFSPSEMYWDRYHGEDHVIIDDIDDKFPYKKLLRILDIYLETVPRKNMAPMPLVASRIWITADCHPRDLYNWKHMFPNLDDIKLGNKISQLVRRCTKIVHFSTPFAALTMPDEVTDMDI